MSTEVQTASSPIEIVSETLETYAGRGVFRGFSPAKVQGAKATFKIMWHRDTLFELVFDPAKGSLRFPLVLPNVPADSEMYRHFKAYLKSKHAEDLPEHRRIDTSKAEIRPFNRGGNVALTLKLKGDDYEYGTRKLIHLVHEVFMEFLRDGLYLEYMIETFDLDPDHP